MGEWSRTRYGAVSSNVRTRARADSDKAELLSVTATSGVISQSQSGRRDISATDKSKYLTVEPGDVVYNTMRMWQGVSGFSEMHGIVSPAYTVVRPSARVLDGRFLAYLMKLPYNIKLYRANSQGLVSDTWNLKFGALASLELDVPPLEEQRRIAEILDSIDETIQATERLVAKLTAVRVGLLCDLLAPGMSPSPPPEWGVSRVEELLGCRDPAMRSGPFGSTLLASDLVDEGVPLLGIDNVQREHFVADYRRFVTPAKANELRRYRVFPRDLMITIMGTVGRCCVVPETVGNALSSKHVWTLTLDSERYVPELACLQMNYSPWVLAHFGRDEQGGIMSAIRSETLRSLRLPTPPMAAQQEIWAVLHEANCRIEAQNAVLSKLRITRDGLVADLLSGRVRTVAA